MTFFLVFLFRLKAVEDHSFFCQRNGDSLLFCSSSQCLIDLRPSLRHQRSSSSADDTSLRDSLSSLVVGSWIIRKVLFLKCPLSSNEMVDQFFFYLSVVKELLKREKEKREDLIFFHSALNDLEVSNGPTKILSCLRWGGGGAKGALTLLFFLPRPFRRVRRTSTSCVVVTIESIGPNWLWSLVMKMRKLFGW